MIDSVENGNSREVLHYVTFYVGSLLLGVPVSSVQEVLHHQPLTDIPLAPGVVAGLMNLRGQILTAIDMRKRLGLGAFSNFEHTVNVIVTVGNESYSLITDAVGDVMELSADSFELVPSTVIPAMRDVSQGVHQLERGLLVVVDPTKLILSHSTVPGGVS